MGEAKKSKNKKTSAFGKFYQFPHLFLLFEDTDSPIMLLNFLILFYYVVPEETNHSNSTSFLQDLHSNWLLPTSHSPILVIKGAHIVSSLQYQLFNNSLESYSIDSLSSAFF